MSKNARFLVTVTGATTTCNTLREVCEALGRRVTRKEIASGSVPEVQEIIEDAATPQGYARSLGDDGVGELIKLHEVLPKSDMKQEVILEAAMDEHLEEKLNEILDEGNTDDMNEDDVDNLIENNDLDKENNDDPEDDIEDDIEDDDKPQPTKMELLMAKMRELNAKKQAEQNGKTASGKSGKVKKIEFTGEYPEIGTFTEKKQLQKFYKQLTDEQLKEWLELEGLTYKPSDNEPINRMRQCMAIMDLHFPKEVKSNKKKSKYAEFSTEQLLEMAIDNGIEVKEGKGDPRILRMYTIMELKKAGLLE